MKIAFMCSGGGGSLAFIRRTIAVLPEATITCIFADRECGAILFAKKVGLPFQIVDYDQKNELEMIIALKSAAPDLIVTSFNRILGPLVLSAFSGRLVNLHYSLLPLFPGTIGSKPVRLALEAGCRWLGATAHLVEAEVDKGAILCQGIIPAQKSLSFDQQMDRVFRAGCVTLLNALLSLSAETLGPAKNYGELQVNPAFYNGPMFDENFWLALKSDLS